MNKEEFLYRSHNKGLTMKDLRKFILDNPEIEDDTEVLVERITDFYFQEQNWHDGSKITGWDTYNKEGYHYYQIKKNNEKWREEIKNRENKNYKTEYPQLKDPKKYIVEDLEEFKEQFHSAHCITKEQDNSLVLIYSHY